MRLCSRHNIAEEEEGSAGGGGQGRERAFSILPLLLLAPKPSRKAEPGRGCSREEQHPSAGCCCLAEGTLAVQGSVTKCGGTSEAGGSGPAAPACCLITPAEAFPALPGRARQCDHASGFLARRALPLAPCQCSPSPPENSAPFKKKQNQNSKPSRNPHTPLRAQSLCHPPRMGDPREQQGRGFGDKAVHPLLNFPAWLRGF